MAKRGTPQRDLFAHLWTEFFGYPIDEMALLVEPTARRLKDVFINGSWTDVYDLVEEIVTAATSPSGESLRTKCNTVLEKHLSGYRFVGGILTRLSSEQEVAEIEQALANPLPPTQMHLREALTLLSDRDEPSFRNSIKESISAVEALCRDVAGKEKSVLSDALKALADEKRIHPALSGAFSKLYGYTSDESGVRHALTDQSEEPDFEDAKFMLVACSAFINYVTGKMAKGPS